MSNMIEIISKSQKIFVCRNIFQQSVQDTQSQEAMQTWNHHQKPKDFCVWKDFAATSAKYSKSRSNANFSQI